MLRRRAEATIAATPERVWALYDDIAGTPAWVPFTETVLSVSGPAGVGTVYSERTRLAGIASVGTWRITEHEPPRRQVHVSDDMGLHSVLTITMERAGDTTRLAQDVTIDSRLPGPLGWLHEHLVAPVIAQGMRGAVDGARRYLGTGARS
jgi:uncharacterized protein YndB with AHSA1/START domain